MSTIYISLTNRCDLGIDNEHLVVIQRNEKGGISGLVNLGWANKRAIKALQEAAKSLEIHANERL